MFDETVMDKRSALPRHAQIEAYIRRLIECGRLAPGERIPPETELARALGVSRMTVNKAILALTRAGLFERERGLGTFVADPAKAAARTVSVILPLDTRAGGDEQDCYFGPLCRAIQAAAEERRYRISLAYLPEGGYLRHHRQEPSDGYIIISPDVSRQDDLLALSEEGAPLVLVGARWPQLARIPMVDSDNVSGAMMAVRHLTVLGHRRIVMVYAGLESSNTRDRLEGYHRALREAGLTPNPAWEIGADSAEGMGSAVPVLQRILSLPHEQRPTAIFAAGYYLGLETLNITRSLGIPAPGAISVVGYDDPYSAQLSYPPLTTLRQPLAEMGAAAVELLDQQARRLRAEPPGPQAGRSQGELGEEAPGSGDQGGLLRLLPPQLMIRGSAAAACDGASSLVLSTASLPR
jgi:LacI family transcriptional regulator